MCFCGPDGAQRSKAFLYHFYIIDQENVVLIYSVTIYQQKTTDFAPSGNFQHKLLSTIAFYLISVCCR